MGFYLHGDHEEKLRLRSYSSASKAGRMVLKIELETADPYTLARALERLGAVQAGQKAPKPQPKRSALPAPEGGA